MSLPWSSRNLNTCCNLPGTRQPSWICLVPTSCLRMAYSQGSVVELQRSLHGFMLPKKFQVPSACHSLALWHAWKVSLSGYMIVAIGRASLARENEAYFSYIVRRIITSRSSRTLCRWQWSRKSWILIDYYGGCLGNSGKYLCLAIMTNNEECQFSRSTTCLGQTYTCDMIMCI